MLTKFRNKLNQMLFGDSPRILSLFLAACLGCLSFGVFATPSTPEHHYGAGKKALNAEDFQAAIDEFHKLQRDYPNNPFAQRSVLDLAYAYYRLGNYSLARTEAERFIAETPHHPQLAFAYYVAGLTHYTESIKLLTSENVDPKRPSAKGRLALSYFGQLTERFPDSEYSEHAKLRSSYLLGRLTTSQHELETIAPIEQLTADFNTSKAIKKENWILEQLPTNYTLQLISSPNPVEIENLIEEHGLASQAMIYQIQRHNGTIYTLLYGMFASEKIAMDVGSRLPRDILNLQPLIKPLANVQFDITENGALLSDRYTKKSEQRKTIQKTVIENNQLKTKRVARQKAKEPRRPQELRPRQTADFVNKWILAQNPKDYTIQLAGMSREKSIQRFIKEHQANGEIGYYHGLNRGKNWYAAVFGSYTTMTQAKAAAAELKAELGVDQPWIRRMREIQESIKSLN